MSKSSNYLSSGIKIKGNITFSSDMRIDGEIEGAIESTQGAITIGDQARISGDIKGKVVTIYGSVNGQIHADDCQLKNNSSLVGDITTKTLNMESGARLDGKALIG